ncbi:MAG: DMT family transporter [Spirochaetales bacterium]|nr:DMT family transporter [Spirochaetales bacterium]
MGKENILKKTWVMVLLATLCQALWGVVFPVIKKSYELFSISGVGSTLLFASIRFMVAGVILLLIDTVMEKRFPVLDKKGCKSVLMLGTIQTGLAYAFQYIAMMSAASINCSILNGTGVIFSTIIAHFLFKDDKMTVKKAIGAVLGFIGVLVCFVWGGKLEGFSLKGEGLMLLSILTFVTGTNISRIITKGIKSIVVSGYNLLIGGVELFVLALLLGGRIGNGGLYGIICLLFLSFTSCVCLYLWTALSSANSVSKVAVFQCVNPITGAIAASLLLGENVFQPKYIVSVLLVTISIIIITKGGKKIAK